MNKNEKKQSKGGIIAIGIIMLLSALNGVSGDNRAFALVILFVILFFVFFAIIGAANKKKKANPQSSAVKPDKKEQNTAAYAQNTPERKYYDSDCERASSEHEHNRRLEQLETFLKDGIISREEYNILKAKYMR